MSVTLSYSATTIVLPRPNFPGAKGFSRPQVSNVTLGGRTVTVDLRVSGTLARPAFPYRRLPKADFDALYSFIDTTVNRREKAFTLTLWDATVLTVKYWAGIDGFREVAHQRFGGTIEFREQP